MADAFFPLGASYYPPHHRPEEWPRDVANMAAAGMTCIRSAELLASWDYIEKVRGQPDWQWLDALFEAAHQHGLRVLLGTGSPNPPIWLIERYPDAQIVDREGHPFPTGTVWGWACRNHPGYRAEVERYLLLLIERYKDHPALWAWQIDNEPGYPFITRRGEAHPRLYDYHPHTADAFRDWLQAKYADLDALNLAWRWDCTHHQYSDWAQVQPPRSLPAEWGVVTAWLDWRTFLNANMAAFIRWQHKIIKRHDQRHPTMTNIFAFSNCEVEMALDPWLMAAQVDAIGYDLYPGIIRVPGGRPHLHQAPEYISMFLDFGRSTALHAGSTFWLPELESGPIAGWALGPDYATKPADLTRYNLEALAHGARAILYQGYREWPCIPIHWGALADFHGRPTARYNAAQAINKLVGEHAELFRRAAPPRAEIAIYADTRNEMLLHGMGAGDLLGRCQRGAYAAFWRAGYPLEFVDSAALARWNRASRQPEHLSERQTGRHPGGSGDRQSGSYAVADHSPLCPSLPVAGDLPYKLIVLPAALLIDADTAATLRRFVERGGTLIGFAKCAWVDHRGWSWADQPGAGLDELFGVRAGEIERDDSVAIEIAAGKIELQLPAADRQSAIPGHWHRQPLTPTSGGQALAHFADGATAIVHRRVGAGQTFYVGTHLDAAALESAPAAALLRALAEQAGLRRPLELLEAPTVIDAHLLVAGARRLVLLTNNGPQSARVSLRLPGAALASATELLHGMPVALSDGALALELAAWDGAVVLAE